MNGIDLVAELTVAQQHLTPVRRDYLLRQGADPGIIVALLGMMPALIEGRTWQPVNGAPIAVVVPVLVDDPLTPESRWPAMAPLFGQLVDLIAFSIATPKRWALRTGNAQWLGAVQPQYLDPDPVEIWQTPMAWLRAGGMGLCPLTHSHHELRRLLLPLHSISVADSTYGRFLQRALSAPPSIPHILVRPTAEEVA
jgi:hypothetical protein